MELLLLVGSADGRELVGGEGLGVGEGELENVGFGLLEGDGEGHSVVTGAISG